MKLTKCPTPPPPDNTSHNKQSLDDRERRWFQIHWNILLSYKFFYKVLEGYGVLVFGDDDNLDNTLVKEDSFFGKILILEGLF